MFGNRVERKLVDVSRRLKRAREDLVVLDEQLAVLRDHAEEDLVRALVAEGAERESRETQRHADALARSRADLVQTIADLERAQDELLARLP